MDTFALSLLPAAAEAGLDTTTVSRNLPLFRRDVGRRATTLAVVRCTERNHLVRSGLVLLITRQRLVVTRRTKLLHRVLPHLSAGLSELSDVTWSPNPGQLRIDLQFRLRGREHHLRVRPGPGQLGRLEATFEVALGGRIPRQR
ncbi:MAG: hypothetical protein WCA46_12030 [Actinocatenispora sp.]